MASKSAGGPDSGGEGEQALDKGSGPGKSRVDAGLDPRSQEAIGRTLKAHYEDLVRAPVPNKFLEMLDRLEATEQSGQRAGTDEAE